MSLLLDRPSRQLANGKNQPQQKKSRGVFEAIWMTVLVFRMQNLIFSTLAKCPEARF
jgi:hypothetical protein